MEQSLLQEDNQQKSSEIQVTKELGWLGGIIDGEGTFTVRMHRQQKTKTALYPLFCVTNTDFDIIDEIERILRKNSIGFWVDKHDATERWKASKRIEVYGQKRLIKFIPVVLDYLIGKKEEAALTLQFCINRDKLYNEHRNKAYYTDLDFELYQKISLLHGHQDQVRKNISEILRDYTQNTVK